MQFKIEVVQGVLRAELYGRQSAEETQRFVDALGAEAQKSGCQNVLVAVRASRAIFEVEQYGISELLKRAAANPGYRIALVGDSEELRASHQYIEVLARQQGVELKSFREEAAALDWLASRARGKSP